MFSHPAKLVVALIVLASFKECGHDAGLVGGGGVHTYANHTLAFAYNGGNCTQSLDGTTPTSGMVDIPRGDGVTFSGSGGYTLNFAPPNATSCMSPFQAGVVGTCIYQFSSAAVSNGTADNSYYPYGAVTVGGQSCNNSPGSFGMRLRP